MSRTPDVVAADKERAQLQAWLKHFRALLAQIDEAALILQAAPDEGPGPTILYANRAIGAMVGKKREDLEGDRLDTLFSGDDLRRFIDRLPEVARRGGLYRFTGAITNGEGEQVPCAGMVRGFLGLRGQPLSFAVTLAAVKEPEVREVEVEVEKIVEVEKKEDPAAASRDGLEMVGVIASGIAHDFNNHLTPVSTILSSLAALDELPEEVKTSISDALAGVEEGTRLAKQLLNAAKDCPGERTTADILPVVEKVAKLGTTGSNVIQEVVCESELPAVVIDETEISQVFHNLVVNACQAMENGGSVRIEATTTVFAGGNDVPDGLLPGKYVEVSVRDRGCGIPQDKIEGIFQLFATTKETGTGLGLARCRSIVRSHGGAITVTSKENVGSTFTVFLPVAAKLDEEELPVAPPSGGKGLDDPDEEVPIEHACGPVLIVDDQEAILKATGQILEKFGYSVTAVTSGQEAINIYQSNFRDGEPFVAVILDVTLPGGLNGIETLEEIRKIDHDVRAVFSTGYHFEEPRLNELRRGGYVGVLPKPYKVDGLARCVADAVRAAL